MPINFIEKPGLFERLIQSNYRIEQVGTTWVGYYIDPTTGLDVASNGSDAIAEAINALIVSYNPLPFVKKVKRVEVREKLVALISLDIRPISSHDEFLWMRDMWKSIVVASRNPNANWQKFLDLDDQAQAFLSAINTATNWQTLWAIDYLSDATWGR